MNPNTRWGHGSDHSTPDVVHVYSFHFMRIFINNFDYLYNFVHTLVQVNNLLQEIHSLNKHSYNHSFYFH